MASKTAVTLSHSLCCLREEEKRSFSECRLCASRGIFIGHLPKEADMKSSSCMVSQQITFFETTADKAHFS